MKHPFINNRILSLYYGLFWIVMGMGYFLIQYLGYQVTVREVLPEVLLFFILYPGLGASIWYVTQFSGGDEPSRHFPILLHLVASTVMCGIWLYLSLILIRTFFSDQYLYWANTLPIRVIIAYLLYAVYALFFYAIGYYLSLKNKIKKEEELKSLIRDAELRALKSQINPHFLFNSLNSVASLTMSNPERAREMIIGLSDFMRYSLKHKQSEMVAFNEEIENINRYLSIEKVRFGARLNTVYQFDEDSLQAQLPNMILLPLLENAIKYGVYEALEPVTIQMEGKLEQNLFRLIIFNDYQPDCESHKGEGIGLQNIRNRLERIYGTPSLLKINDSGNSYRVELLLPQNIKKS